MVKLSRDDWLLLGLTALTDEGFVALKADRLTKRAGVTRGSFYGYFADVSAYHAALIDRWFETSRHIAAELDTLTPEDRLRALIRASADSNATLERAIRAWAHNEPWVAARVEEVDRFRLHVLTQTLTATGIDPTVAASRAKVLYAGAVGATMLPPSVLELSAQDLDELASLMLSAPRD